MRDGWSGKKSAGKTILASKATSSPTRSQIDRFIGAQTTRAITKPPITTPWLFNFNPIPA